MSLLSALLPACRLSTQTGSEKLHVVDKNISPYSLENEKRWKKYIKKNQFF